MKTKQYLLNKYLLENAQYFPARITRKTANKSIWLSLGIGGAIAFSTVSPAIAQTAVTSLNATYQTGTASSLNTTVANPCQTLQYPTCGAPITMQFGVGATNDRQLSGFVAGGQTYSLQRLVDAVTLRRLNNSTITGQKHVVFFESGSTNTQLRSSATNTMEDVLLDTIVNRGADNVFANQGNLQGNNNNIERVDFVTPTGISVPSNSLGNVGFLVLERGANDPFKIAAITSIDASGNPTGFGPLLNVLVGSWGTSASNGTMATTVMRRDQAETNLRPSDRQATAQNIGGVYLSLTSLGVTANQTIYGYALFPNDITVTASNDLVNYNNFSPNTSDASGSGGLDLMAGGGIFTQNGLANVSGTLYQDNNADSNLNGGDTNLPANITVKLLDSTGTNTLATTTTNTNGQYTFIGVASGSYRVQVDTTDTDIPTLLRLSTLNNLSVTVSGSAVTNQNFGLRTAADLSLTKTTSSPNPNVGQNVTFTITVSNAGPASATGVNVADLLPAGLTFVSATASQGTYNNTTGVWAVGSLASATNATLQVTATVTTTGTKTNTAQVSASGQYDPDSTPNNSLATEDDQANVTIASIATLSISGTVFDDVNYGGGAGRNYTTANNAAATSGISTGTIRRPNVRVELYNAAGNYLTATTTDSNGAYTFNNQPANATYTVRVVNNTVTSVRPSSGGTLIPVQTYRTDASSGSAVAVSDRVGGENPTLVDAGNGSAGTTLNTTTGVFTAGISGQAQSITQVVAATSNITGLDFGFNFDTIVSVRDSGQGSLRQFIINSNALNNTSLAQVGVLSGREESIFMLSDGAVHPGLRAGLVSQFSNGVATITLATALPAITGTNGRVTSIDGRTQTALTGDTNPPIFNVTTGPEIIIDVAAGAGLQVNAGSTFIKNIGITGANGVGTAGVGVFFNGSVSNNSRLENATVFNHDNSGVFLGNGATNITVLSNIIRNNGITDPLADGIELNNASSNFLQENSILNHLGYGIDLHTTANNSNRIEGNQIINNGSPDDGQDAGIGIRLGSNNIIGQNTIANNFGDGIVIVSGTGNTITENSIYNNGGLGIDLGGGTEGDDVTVNDSGDGDTGANDLLNFPIIEKATLTSNSLIVTGFARAGARIEFFVKAPDPSGFGEGQTYLITYVEGSTDDSDSNTGTYTSPVNGVNQGTDTTNRFRFAIPLNSLSTTIDNVDRITATATCFIADSCTSATNGSTSEFSGSLTVTASPLISLVKRITAINGVPLTNFDGDPQDPNGNSNTDEDTNWPLPLDTYLPGRIHVDDVKPGDEVEYTIYFLNNQSPATNITVCDPIPDHQTFIASGYNAASPHPTQPDALPTDTGIAMALDANTLPTNPTTYLTNANDSDRGRYYLANFAETPPTCQSNANGAVVVNVVDSTTNIPNSSAPGTPTNSYGFIRFKVKVN